MIGCILGVSQATFKFGGLLGESSGLSKKELGLITVRGHKAKSAKEKVPGTKDRKLGANAKDSLPFESYGSCILLATNWHKC